MVDGRETDSATSPDTNGGTTRIQDVENIAFATAKSQANVRPFTKRMIQLYSFCLIGTLNSCINGFDGSLMSAINDMKPYLNMFDMKSTGSKTGFAFGIYTIGGICGGLFAGPLTDTWDRRWGMVAGGTFIERKSEHTYSIIG